MTTRITHSAIVPYSCEQMFALVNNIRDYYLFVPYCKSSDVHVQTDELIEATLTLEISINVPFLGKKHAEQAFKTRNLLVKNKRMDMTLLEGPMDKLAGFWAFESYGDHQTRVILSLEVAFSKPMWSMAFNAVSGQVANTLVSAFVKRADEIYGDKRGDA